MNNSLRKYLRTPATIASRTGSDMYSKAVYGPPVATMVYSRTLTAAQIAILAIEHTITHAIMCAIPIDMTDHVSIDGVPGNTPRQVRAVLNKRGVVDHWSVVI